MPCVVVEGNQHGLLEFLRASFELYYNVCSEKLFAFCFFFNFFIYFLFSSRFKQSVYKLLGEYEAQDVVTAGR